MTTFEEEMLTDLDDYELALFSIPTNYEEVHPSTHNEFVELDDIDKEFQTFNTDTLAFLNEDPMIKTEYPDQQQPNNQAGYQTYPYGNNPRIPVQLYTEGREGDYKSYGIRDNLAPIVLQAIGTTGTVLTIENYDPQLWPRVIDLWKETVINSYIKLDVEHTGPQMMEYLATFLAGMAKAMWEAWKVNHRAEFEDLEVNGPNVYNFCNKIGMLITASDPNTGNLNTQREAMYHLEQISIRNWTYIKPFLSDFVYYANQAGCNFSKEMADRLFKKLLGALGRKIEDSWKNQDLRFMMVDQHEQYQANVLVRAYFVVQKLKEICSNIEIERNLKGEYSFCNTIFTPQKYDYDYKPSWKAQVKAKRPNNYSNRSNNTRYNYKPNSYNRSKFQPKRFVRKSEAKKPFLDDKKHVRKVKKENTYKQISCFTCSNLGHFASNCPYKVTELAKGNPNAILVDFINEDLLKIDDAMSDSESIYSIIEDDLELRLKDLVINQEEQDSQLIKELLNG